MSIFNSPILEVAIGMIFFYLLLSLICSALNELIEGWLQNRANDLETGIRRLLDDPDPYAAGFAAHVYRRTKHILERLRFNVGMLKVRAITVPKTDGLASRLYNHALIRALYAHPLDLPAYIPARTFALALMDLVAPGKHGAEGATRTGDSQPNILVINGNAPARPEPPLPLNNLRTGIADFKNVPSAKVQDALLTLVDAAGDDPVKVRENIETWFNNTTDRIAGWYRRRVQTIILVLGICTAVVLNADSVLVLNTLWHNSALQTSLAAQAEQYMQTAKAESANRTTEGLEKLADTHNQLANLGLPIGWNGQTDAHKLPGSLFKDPRRAISWSLYQLDLHWLGWLITGIAISVGAPFWFDLLNKFIVVRSTVKPKEKSEVEGSKD